MGALVVLVRSEVRRRWRSLVVVALLIAFIGAVTLSAVAGARRTASSFDRFLDATRSSDVLVFAQDIRSGDIDRLRSLPGVEAIGVVRQLALMRPDGEMLAVGGPLDDVLARDVNRLRIVAGRDASPSVPEEVVIGESLAAAVGIQVGDRVPVRSFTQAQVDDPAFQGGDPAGPSVELQVVGISRSASDLGLQGGEGGVLLLQRSFVDTYGPDIGNFSGERGRVLFVRLDQGDAGTERFLGQLRGIMGDRPFDVDPAALSTGGVQESIDLMAVGVLVFGAVAGAAGLIAAALVIARQLSMVAAGQAPVRDLGMERRRRAWAIAAPVLAAIGVGVVVAAIGAWLASPLLSFGLAARAEPDPGRRLDVVAVLGGGVLLAAVLVAVTTVVSLRLTRPPRDAAGVDAPSPALVRSLETSGLAPPAVIGVGMAVRSGRGPDAVPVRSSLVGVVIAVVGVTASVVFSASLTHLLDTPSAQGTNWDLLQARTLVGPEARPCGRIETPVVDVPGIEAVANVCTLSITIDDRAVGAVGLTSLRGAIEPTVLEGRAPRGDDEVALGADTMAALGLEVGDTTTGRSPEGAVDYRVVGRVVIPSQAMDEAQSVADGAVFSGDGLARLFDPGNVSGASSLVMRVDPGTDLAEVERNIPPIEGAAPTRMEVPLEVDRLSQVDRLPVALGIFLGVLGALAVSHLLVTSVQRRRRDFAILKSIGFSRPQVHGVVASQATTVALIGVVIGVASGVLLGGALWRQTARNIGVVEQMVVPPLAVAVVAGATLLIALVVSAIPARIAARTRPAVILRGE